MFVVVSNPLSENTQREVEVNPGDRISFIIWDLGIFEGIYHEIYDMAMVVSEVVLVDRAYPSYQVDYSSYNEEKTHIFEINHLAEIMVIIPHNQDELELTDEMVESNGEIGVTQRVSLQGM